MGNISEYMPGNGITHSWEAATGLPWDPFDSCAVNIQRELVCPKCSAIVVARSSAYILDSTASFSPFWLTAYLAPGKTGLAQEGFTCTCSKCGFIVTRENLAVSEFVCDLVKDPKNANDVNQFGDAVYLP